jgi:hypothetical protein
MTQSLLCIDFSKLGIMITKKILLIGLMLCLIQVSVGTQPDDVFQLPTETGQNQGGSPELGTSFSAGENATDQLFSGKADTPGNVPGFDFYNSDAGPPEDDQVVDVSGMQYPSYFKKDLSPYVAPPDQNSAEPGFQLRRSHGQDLNDLPSGNSVYPGKPGDNDLPFLWQQLCWGPGDDQSEDPSIDLIPIDIDGDSLDSVTGEIFKKKDELDTLLVDPTYLLIKNTILEQLRKKDDLFVALLTDLFGTLTPDLKDELGISSFASLSRLVKLTAENPFDRLQSCLENLPLETDQMTAPMIDCLARALLPCCILHVDPMYGTYIPSCRDLVNWIALTDKNLYWKLYNLGYLRLIQPPIPEVRPEQTPESGETEDSTT